MEDRGTPGIFIIFSNKKLFEQICAAVINSCCKSMFLCQVPSNVQSAKAVDVVDCTLFLIRTYRGHVHAQVIGSLLHNAIINT